MQSSTLWFLIFFSLVSSTSSTSPANNPKGCLDPSELSDTIDYFPHKVTAQHSKFWNITYHNTYKIIENHEVDQTYLLYQCGTEPPTGTYDLSISVPLTHGVAITSTTQIPQLEQLGLRRSIKVNFGAQWINSPCINTLQHQNIIKLYDETNITSYIETINPNLLIFKDVEEEPIVPNNDEASYLDRYFYISEHHELSNKAIYEWHKVYAALFNLEQLANTQFNDSVDRYDCAVDNAKYIAAQKHVHEDPTVLWAYHWNWFDEGEGTHHIGWDIAKCPNYYCEYASHCHSTLLNVPLESALLSDEEFRHLGKDADVWIFPSYNFASLLKDHWDILEEFKSVQTKQVYMVHDGWLEQKLAEYDVVLQDFCHIAGHNDDSLLPHELKWFYKVPLDDSDTTSEDIMTVTTEVDPKTCRMEDVDEPWYTRASQCTYIRYINEKDTSKDIDENQPYQDTGGNNPSSGVGSTHSLTCIYVLILFSSIWYMNFVMQSHCDTIIH